MQKPLLFLLILLPGCLGPDTRRRLPGDEDWRVGASADLEPGESISQAMIGVSYFETARREGGTNPDTGFGSDGLEQLPLIAGAIQETTRNGEYFDFGFEGGAAVGFVTSGGFVAASGANGLIVAVDIDLLLVDLFIGPFVSLNIGERMRFYAGAGPVVDFANYSHEGSEGSTEVDESGTGLGLGWYARGGVEFLFDGGYMLGVGYRWFDSNIALSGDLGTLDLVGSQAFVSFSTGF
ncbi:MAG: hypothetical protein ACI9F9_000879 [Candidatus Paceibacteria bacterium]|jgi:hypothetical protein